MAIPDLVNKKWTKPVALSGFGFFPGFKRCGMMTLKPGAYIKKMQIQWEEKNGVTGIALTTNTDEQLMVGKY